jgi:hypothetical protein
MIYVRKERLDLILKILARATYMRAPKLQRRRDGMPSRWQYYCNGVEALAVGIAT